MSTDSMRHRSREPGKTALAANIAHYSGDCNSRKLRQARASTVR
jgi:hypothetical protein